MLNDGVTPNKDILYRLVYHGLSIDCGPRKLNGYFTKNSRFGMGGEVPLVLDKARNTPSTTALMKAITFRMAMII